MKKALLTIALTALGVAGSFGQGTVFFQNFASGPVTAQGGGYAGSQFEVSLFWMAGDQTGLGTGGVIAGGTYFDASAPMFGSGSLTEANQDNGAGFFDAGVITVTGAPAGLYTFVAVAYTGGTYASALSNPTAWAGASTPFLVNLVEPPSPVGTTVIPTFSVAPVPEPSTFALAGLGLASLLIFRRRK